MSTAPRPQIPPRPDRTLTVNGVSQPVRAGTLQDALVELGLDGRWVGTAVNGDLVPRVERAAHPIHDGDRIEVLSPMQGG